MASEHNFKLSYFDFRGRGELIRVLFAFSGQKFEDVRLSFEQFAVVKPTLPFGQVPTLEIDGKVYAQTFAIANYLAKEFGLYGQNSLEQLLIDQVTHHIKDIETSVEPLFREKDPAKKAEIKVKVQDEILPRMIGYLEKLLNDSSSGYFAGAQISLADIAAAELVSAFANICVLDTEKFPRLKDLADKVHNHPKLCKYFEERPPDKYPF